MKLENKSNVTTQKDEIFSFDLQDYDPVVLRRALPLSNKSKDR